MKEVSIPTTIQNIDLQSKKKESEKSRNPFN
eukprot:CAMPEP_0170566278 /NCGR_PEP_ID=MMETSP0211-20121228/79726_1 /TAXON_ID=311385 /ORGANISM="Pseudokeronopsis sp., Strain OXSARD2" /LENGTH=30 /DNA_ID= /DNA_START= /DNA_END= /DNA_ORIENTATION=